MRTPKPHTIWFYFGPVFVLLLNAGCSNSVDQHVNSSLEENDYYDAPLSERSQRYEDALLTSNTAVELIRDGNMPAVYSLLSQDLRTKGTEEQLAQLISSSLDQFGDFSEYKVNQWSFTRRTIGGTPVVYSTKIVVHEEATAYYIFGFEVDNYSELAAIHFIRGNPKERLFVTLSGVL